jgi:transposase-like protein
MTEFLSLMEGNDTELEAFVGYLARSEERTMCPRCCSNEIVKEFKSFTTGGVEIVFDCYKCGYRWKL